MNVRFAELARENPLILTDVEQGWEAISISDGRSRRDQLTKCDQDIHIGLFFDGTNNKYRDTPGFSHSNVARLYEVYPGTNAAQTPPKFAPRVLPGGGTAPRPVFPDRPFKPSSIPAQDYAYYRKVYVPGLGTPMPDAGDTGTGRHKTGGLALALLSQVRLDWALLQLVNQVHAAVFGQPIEASVAMRQLFAKVGSDKARAMALGARALGGLLPAAMARDLLDRFWAEFDRETGTYDQAKFDRLLKSYVSRLDQALVPRRANKPHLRKIRLSVFGFSRGATEARAWVNMLNDRWGGELCGIPLQIDFLGLFDTVASVGLAHAAPPVLGLEADGHWSWAQVERLAVPPNVRRCVHLVAAHEVRGAFPLDSVCQGDRLPSNCKEIVYPGVHSDVGGGYPPEDQGRCLGSGAAGDSLKLSQIALAQMYREARMAGVPLAAPPDMVEYQRRNFAIAPQLRADFNAYIEATRTGRVAPTNGKGEPAFAAMFPTETQPRGELHRIIRHHYGILLRWRKAVARQPGGVSALPGLRQSSSIAKHQDIEDLRGAEQELLKEVAFLQSKDPQKFDAVDDPLMDMALDYTGKASYLPPLPWLKWVALVGLGLSWDIKRSARAVMQEKQMQWDTWLREEWHADDLSVPAAAARLFEHYVHDSRAWFKPGLQSDNKELAPDDEDWFVLGGREKARQQRLAAAQRRASSPDPATAAQGREELKCLQAEGAPLVHGGREPYRLWGYLRHRHIYQAGRLKDAAYTSRQAAIEQQEREREAQRRHEERLRQERERHEREVQSIKARNREVLLDQRLSTQARDEYNQGARSTLSRENALHQQNIEQIEQALRNELR